VFANTLPLVGTQHRGLEVGGAFSLSTTKLMDAMKLGLDDDEGAILTASTWESAASNLSSGIAEVAELVREVDESLHRLHRV
jgi:hypothetical protein